MMMFLAKLNVLEFGKIYLFEGLENEWLERLGWKDYVGKTTEGAPNKHGIFGHLKVFTTTVG